MTIRLDNAGVRHADRWIFRHASIEASPGRTLAVLGPNGRGKTTLMRAMLGAQPLTEGQREAIERIGYVAQSGGPAPRYRVLDMVVMGRARTIGVFGSPSSDDYFHARQALERVGMLPLADRPFDVISGGEKQLALLARALATGLRTILLDEPASALDLANQGRLLAILDDLRRQREFTIIFSTHLPQHALHAADETLLMLPGHDWLRGPTSDVLTETNLERLYGLPIRRIPVPGSTDAIVPMFGAGMSLDPFKEGSTP